MVLVDNFTGYQWIYGMGTKDEMLKVARQWYSYIVNKPDISWLHLFMIMPANINRLASKNSLLISMGVENLFQHSHEQWQNEAAE